MWIVWAISRLIMWNIVQRNNSPSQELVYYYAGVSGNDPNALTEYPLLGTLPAHLAYYLTPDPSQMVISFVALCVACDAFFFAFLLRGNGTGRYLGAAFWMLFGIAAAQQMVYRLDIFLGVTVALAALFLSRYPRLAAALIAVATSMKLWPGLLAAGIVGRAKQHSTYHRIAAFAATLLGVSLFIVWRFGLDRLLSPLNYQGERGLQIESPAATFFVWRSTRPSHDNDYFVHYAASKSFEITGPGVETASTITSYLLLGVLLLSVGWALWSFLASRPWDPSVTIAWWTCTILLLLLTNKVFSPQYMLWIGPLLAAALAQQRRATTATPSQLVAGHPLALWSTITLVFLACVVTTNIYPFHYLSFITPPHPNAEAAFLLILRNGLILASFATSVWWLIQELRLQQASTKSSEERSSTPATTS